jgi:hypothetical protein
LQTFGLTIWCDCSQPQDGDEDSDHEIIRLRGPRIDQTASGTNKKGDDKNGGKKTDDKKGKDKKDKKDKKDDKGKK